VDRYPKALLIKDTTLNEETPLHLAINANVPSRVLDYLIQKGPQAVGIQDWSGYTPLVTILMEYTRSTRRHRRRHPTKTVQTMIDSSLSQGCRHVGSNEGPYGP
jgi:hypothetical protein